MRDEAFGVLTGLGMGASLMYIMDPARGHRRRALVKDRFVHFGNEFSGALDVGSRDLKNRARGVVAEARHALRREKNLDDDVLVSRVRSRLGRVVSHPHAITVTAQEGHVILSGLILANEASHLISEVGRIRGVRKIHDRLELHQKEEHLITLQGGRERRGVRMDLLQENWSPATRAMTIALGASAGVYGFSRRDPIGYCIGALGSLVFLRGITNSRMGRVFGVGEAAPIRVHKTIHIGVPVEKIYDFWSRFENFPRFMSEVQEVKDLGQGRSRWTVRGPGGVPVSWRSVVVRQIPDRLLVWESVPGSVIRQSGRVRFLGDERGGTKVELDFAYLPPAGLLAHTFAKLFGGDPKSRLDESLMQLKFILERDFGAIR